MIAEIVRKPISASAPRSQFVGALEVEPEGLLATEVGAGADLPETGHAGSDTQTEVLDVGALRDLAGQGRAGPIRDVSPLTTLMSWGSSSMRSHG
jgi:hypothetical protein